MFRGENSFLGGKHFILKLEKKKFRFFLMKQKHIQIICTRMYITISPQQCAVLPTPSMSKFYIWKFFEEWKRNTITTMDIRSSLKNLQVKLPSCKTKHNKK